MQFQAGRFGRRSVQRDDVRHAVPTAGDDGRLAPARGANASAALVVTGGGDDVARGGACWQRRGETIQKHRRTVLLETNNDADKEERLEAHGEKSTQASADTAKHPQRQAQFTVMRAKNGTWKESNLEVQVCPGIHRFVIQSFSYSWIPGHLLKR